MGINKVVHQKVKAILSDVAPTCGDCNGFACEVLIAGNKHPCSKLDKTVASQPCVHFMPNVHKVTLIGTDKLSALSSMIEQLPADSLKMLGLLMFNHQRTADQGMRVLQRVYVRYRGEGGSNYLSNFMKAYVLYATPEHFKLTSEDGRCILTYAQNCKPIIHTEEEWVVMKEKMIRKGKLIDPVTHQLIARRFRCEEEYDLGLAGLGDGDATTIDSVFRENKVSTRKSKGIPDLAELVQMSAAGYNADKASNFIERDVARDKGEEEPESKGGDVRIRTRGKKGDY